MDFKKLNAKKEKIELEILSLEERKEKIIRKIETKEEEKKLVEMQITQKVAEIMQKTYGEITEDSLERFKLVMEEEQLQFEREKLEGKDPESMGSIDDYKA